MPDEDEEERINRELQELLQELRVALPGIQVLFAFLLTLPFTERFATISASQRHVYFVSFLLAAAASALLIAPTAHHRLRFRRRDKKHLLFVSTRLAIAGLALLALAMTGVVFLVTAVLYRSGTAGAVAGLVAGWFAWFWFGLPLRRELRDRLQGRAERQA
jgi:hypothetical protein